MEFRQLRYFVKVSELSSFSDASKALYISQSTLSQQIRQLEDELGASLLVRDSRHVALSDYGEQFLPYAKQVLRDAEASVGRIRDVQNLKIGTLNVGATYTFCPLLSDTVLSFMREHPGIKLNIFCRSMESLMEMLEHEELDVALSYKPLQSYDNIESHILFNSKLCVIAGNDNPVAKLDRIRLAELEKFPLALPAKGLQARNAFDNLLYGQNFKYDVRLEINDLGVLLGMILQTDLVTLLSRETVSKDPRFTAVEIDHPNSEMEGSFHLLKGSYCKNATKEFLKELIENNSFSMAMDAIERR